MDGVLFSYVLVLMWKTGITLKREALFCPFFFFRSKVIRVFEAKLQMLIWVEQLLSFPFSFGGDTQNTPVVVQLRKTSKIKFYFGMRNYIERRFECFYYLWTLLLFKRELKS